MSGGTVVATTVNCETVVATTVNCEIVLDSFGFYVRCTAPNCTHVSEYTSAKHVARQWAEDHDSDTPDSPTGEGAP